MFEGASIRVEIKSNGIAELRMRAAATRGGKFYGENRI